MGLCASGPASGKSKAGGAVEALTPQMMKKLTRSPRCDFFVFFDVMGQGTEKCCCSLSTTHPHAHARTHAHTHAHTRTRAHAFGKRHLTPDSTNTP